MIIDFHTHNFPDKLASRAISVMCAKLADSAAVLGVPPLRPVGDGRIVTELADMDRCGIDYCVNCPVCTNPENFDAIFRRAMSIRSGAEGEAASKRILQLASIHPRDPQFKERIATLKANGFCGVKLHPNYQNVSLDDETLVPFFTELRDAGLFVISHTGFDPGYVGAPPVASPDQIATLLSRVAGLKFIAGHLGGECGSAPHATDALLPFENCFIDTAVMYLHYEEEEACRIMSEWPADRIVFGTDYFWRDQNRMIEWVKSKRPSPADQEKIFFENAAKLLKIKTPC